MGGVHGRAGGMRLAGWLFGVRDETGARERECRVAGAMLLLFAGYAGIVLPSAGGSSALSVRLVLLVAYLASGMACLFVPIRLMPTWTSLGVATWWLALLTVGEGIAGGALVGYVVGYALIFVFVGLTGQPALVLAVAGLAEVGLLISTVAGNQDTDRVVLAASILVCAALGQVPAWALLWARRVDALVSQARGALEHLADTTSEEEAAERVASLVASLVEADEAIVFLTEHTGSTVYTRRGGYSPGASVDPPRVDIGREQSGLVVLARTGQPLFLADARGSTVASQRLVRDLGMASALYLPLAGDGGMLGAVVAWWTSPHPTVDQLSLRLAETVAIPAGQVLQRARNIGRMDAPAMRDPLTGVGNRRRLDLALADLPVGGTVLLFDLDAFAALNDMYGKQTGDEALRSFGEALRSSVRHNDVVTRVGGDQFAVILPASASSIASGIVIERLQRAWRSPEGCRFSVGVAIRADEESPSETFARAEVDLRTTKRLKTR